MSLVEDHFTAVDNEAHITCRENTYFVFDEPDNDCKIEFTPNDDKLHHINFYTMKRFFELLSQIENPVIVETGTSATLVNSSHLFDKYISKNGGFFCTIDINPGAAHHFRPHITSPNTSAITADSVQVLQNWDKVTDKKIDAVYLDSWDVEYNNPLDAAQHCKKELQSILPHLKDHAILLIDDTPREPLYLPWRNDLSQQIKMMYEITSVMPGKGMLYKDVLDNSEFNYKIEMHQHQLLLILDRKV
jgi:hypothetical protein